MNPTVLSQGELDTRHRKYTATEIRYMLFTGIWAIATLFHMATNRMFTVELHYFLLSAAAVYLLLKPSSIFRLVLLICLQLYEVYNALPMGSNHWIFAAFVNVTILQAIIYQLIKEKNFRIDRKQLLETFAPIVRIELIILYFFVVFHKLNTGFFNTEVSCASNFYVAQNAYSILPSTPVILALNAYFTVLIEALIPILLCFRATRNWGLLIGLIFHCIIAYNPLNGFYDFSSVIFATYFLFTSQLFSNKLFNVYSYLMSRKQIIKAQLPGFSLGKLVILVVTFLIGIVLVHVLTSKFDDYFRHVLWTAFSFTFIAIFITVMFSSEKRTLKTDHAFTIKHGSFLILPLILFLNGFSPYLGLKTESSFAMFSNLRTEGGISNHFIVPVEAQIFDYQKELIQVVTSSDKVLNKYAEQDRLMVLPHFQRLITLRKPDSVTYIRNGQTQFFSYGQASKNHELLQDKGFIFNKIQRFRTVQNAAEQPCYH